MDEFRMLAEALEGPETALSEVRTAIRRLRVALDGLEAALDASRDAAYETSYSLEPTANRRAPRAVTALWTPSFTREPTRDAADIPYEETAGGGEPEAIARDEPPPVSPAGSMVEPWNWPTAPSDTAPEEAAPARDDSGWTSPSSAGNWGQWSAPGAIRDGGWPAPASGDTPVAGGIDLVAAPEARPEDDPGAVREQVRRAVELLKAEIASGPESHREQEDESAAAIDGPRGDDTGDEAESPEDVRDQVRRAVKEAKAEIEAERAGPAVAPEIHPTNSLRVPHYEAVLDERFLAPASLVLEDPEGRVELVRVYRTLAKLECAATANLANYSVHSVTIQLEERKLPDTAEIEASVRYAFERECRVEIEGNRAHVRLSSSQTRVA